MTTLLDLVARLARRGRRHGVRTGAGTVAFLLIALHLVGAA